MVFPALNTAVMIEIVIASLIYFYQESESLHDQGSTGRMSHSQTIIVTYPINKKTRFQKIWHSIHQYHLPAILDIHLPSSSRGVVHGCTVYEPEPAPVLDTGDGKPHYPVIPESASALVRDPGSPKITPGCRTGPGCIVRKVNCNGLIHPYSLIN